MGVEIIIRFKWWRNARCGIHPSSGGFWPWRTSSTCPFVGRSMPLPHNPSFLYFWMLLSFRDCQKRKNCFLNVFCWTLTPNMVKYLIASLDSLNLIVLQWWSWRIIMYGINISAINRSVWKKDIVLYGRFLQECPINTRALLGFIIDPALFLQLISDVLHEYL